MTQGTQIAMTQSAKRRRRTPRHKVVGLFLMVIGWIGVIAITFPADFDGRARAAMAARGWDEFGWAASLVSLVVFVAPLIMVWALAFLMRKPVTRLTDRSESLSRMFDRIADRWDGPKGMSVCGAAWFLAFFAGFGVLSALLSLDALGKPIDAMISFLQFPLMGCLVLFWDGAIRVGKEQVCAQCEYPVDRSVDRPCPECGADLTQPLAIGIGRLWDSRTRAALWWVALALFVGTILRHWL